MKIIVMDSANVRIEVLNVADHMLEDEIELFLSEHGYSLNNISWMAAPIDYVPVQFHEYDTDKENGEEVHATRRARLKDFSIGECPIVAAYDYDEPCDVVILSVRVNKDGALTIIGDEKNDRGNEHEIEADDIFAGHMDFITSEIGE